VKKNRVLSLMGILMFLCHSGSRNAFNDAMRNEQAMAQTLARLMGTEVVGIPHLDTLEKVLRKMNAAEYEQVLALLVRRLIRGKFVDHLRAGMRLLTAMDATQQFSFQNDTAPTAWRHTTPPAS
jgi:hypothetical protein